MKIKCLLYCTKGKAKTQLVDNRNINNKFELCWCLKPDRSQLKNHIVNGKIFAECEMEVEKIWFESTPLETMYFTNKDPDIRKKSCLTELQLKDYLGIKGGYAIHISKLEVFDKPRELSDFSPYCKYQFMDNEHNCIGCKALEKFACIDERIGQPDFCCYEPYNACGKRLTKAPQNMMKVWYKGQMYVLISIQPQWMCEILNGNKTVEVRKQVLNCMKGE